MVKTTMEIDDLFTKGHVDKWIKAWNNHNLNEILSLYSENIIFRSPKVKLVNPDRQSGTIPNKKELKEYFSLGLKKYPNLHFIPVDYFSKNNKVIFEYYWNPDTTAKWTVIEKFEFNTEGLIAKSDVYYGAEE